MRSVFNVPIKVVFTCYGATVELVGITETNYTTDETPMISYVNAHDVLEGRRNCAKASPIRDSDTSQLGMYGHGVWKKVLVHAQMQVSLVLMLGMRSLLCGFRVMNIALSLLIPSKLYVELPIL